MRRRAPPWFRFEFAAVMPWLVLSLNLALNPGRRSPTSARAFRPPQRPASQNATHTRRRLENRARALPNRHIRSASTRVAIEPGLQMGRRWHEALGEPPPVATAIPRPRGHG